MRNLPPGAWTDASNFDILPLFVDNLYNRCTLCPTLVITSKDYVLQLCPEIEHYVCLEITLTAPRNTDNNMCTKRSVICRAPCTEALQLQTFYDTRHQLAIGGWVGK